MNIQLAASEQIIFDLLIQGFAIKAITQKTQWNYGCVKRNMWSIIRKMGLHLSHSDWSYGRLIVAYYRSQIEETIPIALINPIEYVPSEIVLSPLVESVFIELFKGSSNKEIAKTIPYKTVSYGSERFKAAFCSDTKEQALVTLYRKILDSIHTKRANIVEQVSAPIPETIEPLLTSTEIEPINGDLVEAKEIAF
jgi:hypothetical protein